MGRKPAPNRRGREQGPGEHFHSPVLLSSDDPILRIPVPSASPREIRAPTPPVFSAALLSLHDSSRESRMACKISWGPRAPGFASSRRLSVFLARIALGPSRLRLLPLASPRRNEPQRHRDTEIGPRREEKGKRTRDTGLPPISWSSDNGSHLFVDSVDERSGRSSSIGTYLTQVAANSAGV
jgi:hypothetical protein